MVEEASDLDEDSTHVELLVRSEVEDEVAQALLGEVGRHGFATDVRTYHPARDPGALLWLVLAAVPLQAFLDGLAQEAAADGYKRLKELLARLVRRRDAVPRTAAEETVPLVLEDWGSRLRFVLEADLPSQAYRQLFGLDLSAFREGVTLRYDRELMCWQSAPAREGDG